MTDATAGSTPAPRRESAQRSLLKQDARTRRRNAAESRFRSYGLIACLLGVLALVGLLTSVLGNGLSAFRQTYVELTVHLDADKLDPSGARDPAAIAKVTTFGYAPLIERAMQEAMAARGIAIEGLPEKEAAGIISRDAAAEIPRLVAQGELARGVRYLQILLEGRS